MKVYAKEALLILILYTMVNLGHGLYEVIEYTPEGCALLSNACTYTFETTVQWCGYDEDTQQTIELGSQCNAYNALCRDTTYTVVYNCYVCNSNIRKTGAVYGIANYEDYMPWLLWIRCTSLRNDCQATPYTTKYCGRDGNGYIIDLGSRCEAAENVCTLGEDVSDIHVCSECVPRRQQMQVYPLLA